MYSFMHVGLYLTSGLTIRINLAKNPPGCFAGYPLTFFVNYSWAGHLGVKREPSKLWATTTLGITIVTPFVVNHNF